MKASSRQARSRHIAVLKSPRPMEAIVDDREIERRAKILWTQENPSRPWLAVAQRLQMGEDLSTGATEEDRERYRQRVRAGD